MSIYKHKYFLILLFFINQFIFISCVVAQRNTNTVNNVTRDGDEDLFDDVVVKMTKIKAVLIFHIVQEKY